VRPRPSVRDQLVARIADMAPAVRRVFEVRPSREERTRWSSLTVHQLEALVALQQGSLTMGKLCEHLDISESAGTALSDRLVARGMVVREVDLSDRRVVRLSLSKEARAMVDRFQSLKRKRIAEVLAGIDDEDLVTLIRIHERILARAGIGPQRTREDQDMSAPEDEGRDGHMELNGSRQ